MSSVWEAAKDATKLKRTISGLGKDNPDQIRLSAEGSSAGNGGLFEGLWDSQDILKCGLDSDDSMDDTRSSATPKMAKRRISAKRAPASKDLLTTFS